VTSPEARRFHGTHCVGFNIAMAAHVYSVLDCYIDGSSALQVSIPRAAHAISLLDSCVNGLRCRKPP
jgi:hypothetical protein